jgi:hypothetical protein
LGVALGVLRPFARLAIALQAVLQLVQHQGHLLMADLMAPLLQRGGELAQALAGPAQR